MWVNAKGERFWVKYHFKTDQGIECLTQQEADRLAGTDADCHRRDLFDSIKRGEDPSWTLKVQIMPFAEAEAYRINPFDLTKVWPQRDYPLQEVGRLRLTRNPTDFHTEMEQAAFEPSSLVPGIGPSPDKMLLARLFSYADAHRARLGVNYKQIPVNWPRVAVHAYSQGRVMRVENASDPRRRAELQARADSCSTPSATRRWRSGRPAASSCARRTPPRKDDDDWNQAGTLVRTGRRTTLNARASCPTSP